MATVVPVVPIWRLDDRPIRSPIHRITCMVNGGSSKSPSTKFVRSHIGINAGMGPWTGLSESNFSARYLQALDESQDLWGPPREGHRLLLESMKDPTHLREVGVEWRL